MTTDAAWITEAMAKLRADELAEVGRLAALPPAELTAELRDLRDRIAAMSDAHLLDAVAADHRDELIERLLMVVGEHVIRSAL